jgi:hypothetical protein
MEAISKNVLNYLPVVSTFVAAKDLWNLYTAPDVVPMEDEHYYQEITDRSLVAWIALFIPVVGNLVLVVFAIYQGCSDPADQQANSLYSVSDHQLLELVSDTLNSAQSILSRTLLNNQPERSTDPERDEPVRPVIPHPQLMDLSDSARMALRAIEAMVRDGGVEDPPSFEQHLDEDVCSRLAALRNTLSDVTQGDQYAEDQEDAQHRTPANLTQDQILASALDMMRDVEPLLSSASSANEALELDPTTRTRGAGSSRASTNTQGSLPQQCTDLLGMWFETIRAMQRFEDGGLHNDPRAVEWFYQTNVQPALSSTANVADRVHDMVTLNGSSDHLD